MIVLIILGKLIPLLLRGRTSFLKVNNFTNITRLLIKIAFVWLGFSWDFCFGKTMTFSQYTSHFLILVFSYYSPKVKKQCTYKFSPLQLLKKNIICSHGPFWKSYVSVHSFMLTPQIFCTQFVDAKERKNFLYWFISSFVYDKSRSPPN